ncbi:MAG: bifunctional glutamate N-acetyltransferase/amino-acid acetyltransferase ArgJ [Nitriliruptoraceae bacterium]
MIAGWGPTNREGLELTNGGVTAVPGFRAAGCVSGVKASGRPDLALVCSDRRAAVAVTTTTNHVKAPACVVTEAHAADGAAQAVVINAGNANVCTPSGSEHALRLAAAASREASISAEDVLVMSTGVIGVPLPIERIEEAMPSVAADVADDGGLRAAHAMMTTDTRPKLSAYRVTQPDGSTYVIGGMAKGVGMIEPSMATMLAVITCDAAVDPALLRTAVRGAVAHSFNRISVDGDQSTSDTVVVFANGAAGVAAESATLMRALHAVCADLALQIVADGEGASRVAAVTVRGAVDESTAERLARSVATSLLVRAAMHGADPNWGRILMALGNAGVEFDLSAVAVRCAGVEVCRGGVARDFDRSAAAAAMAASEVSIDVEVGMGPGSATVLTCDLTPEYVRFNAEYTT